MAYGVLPTGFSRKELATILSEIEAANIVTFGPSIIQTSASPLGQINGMMADLIAKEWELAEDTYQSYDPDQAEGSRLDTLARIRLLARGSSETDVDFRQSITNAGRARIDLQDIAGAVAGVDGVSYSQVFVNEGDVTDANGIPAHQIAVAVLGGDSALLAQTIREYTVPGIGSYGNTLIETTIDGFCRSIYLLRPTLVPVSLAIVVSRKTDNLGCPPPSLDVIAIGLWNALQGSRKLRNGDDVTLFAIRSIIEALYPGNVEVTAFTGNRGAGSVSPVVINFDEIATFALATIIVTNAP